MDVGAFIAVHSASIVGVHLTHGRRLLTDRSVYNCAEGSEVGDKVFLEGGAAPSEYAKTLKSEPWRSIVESLRAQDGKATFEGKALCTAKGVVTLPPEMPNGASIH